MSLVFCRIGFRLKSHLNFIQIFKSKISQNSNNSLMIQIVQWFTYYNGYNFKFYLHIHKLDIFRMRRKFWLECNFQARMVGNLRESYKFCRLSWTNVSFGIDRQNHQLEQVTKPKIIAFLHSYLKLTKTLNFLRLFTLMLVLVFKAGLSWSEREIKLICSFIQERSMLLKVVFTHAANLQNILVSSLKV